ncbi:MAG: efflux RND transporter periplasmic adaptor subunit [Candidatus Binataceae bacterium]
MSIKSPGSTPPGTPRVHDLEALRIKREPQPQRRSRLLPVALVLLVLAALAAGGYQVYGHTLGRPTEVQTAYVTMQRAGQPGVVLTGSGYVVTGHKYITIGTKILGQIIQEPIEEGQHVKRGELLARIDDRDYLAQLHQAIADRDLAVANVKLKEAQAARLRTLYRNGVESRDQLDVAENALEVARAELARAEAAIDFAKFNVSQCYITSPINGIVLQKYRELGDTINYGGDIQAGGGATDIVQLADTEDMRAEVDINEVDIAKVALGSPAQVIPDAYPDRPFDARLVKIYPEADRQKGTVKVEVGILKPNLAIIKPEMSVRVSFSATPAGAQEKLLLLVPKKALIADGNAVSVWTVRNGAAERVAIKRGRDLEAGVEVKQGLNDGDLVIIDPPADLKDGQKVAAKAG